MSLSTPNVNPDTPVQHSRPSQNGTARNIFSILFRVLLPIAALVIGGIITLHLLKTGPQAKTLPKKKNAVLVETVAAQFGTHYTSVSAMGVVKAAQYISLKPQTSGEVISVSDNLLPGGNFSTGQTMLNLDPRDYQLAVRQQTSSVAQAQNNLKLENGNQLVAKRELDLLGEQVSDIERNLMLRQPQLHNLQTALEIEKTKLEQAQLNLTRTTIKAPFNGIVQTQDVNIGTWVSSSTTLATFIGTDHFWVEVSVPEDQLKWITVPKNSGQQGSPVTIYNPTAWSTNSYREGAVIQLLPGLETQGRMARLLIEVKDPLALESTHQGKDQLLLDSFVRVTIAGKELTPSLQLPRKYLRDGTNLWIFDQAGTLDIRDVAIAYKSQDNVLITEGVGPDEKIIISSLSTPVPGMLLRQPMSTSSQGVKQPGAGKKGGSGTQEKSENREQQ